jgi:SAM-dependent methyltransferase
MPAVTNLPERYREQWTAAFDELLAPALVPGVAILEVGAGRSPHLTLDRRPSASQYVGLDVAKDELEKAPAGSYDEVVVADIVERRSELLERFDLVISWQVLEHVKPLAPAIENMRCYLRDGGLMVSLVSGAHSAFALLNKLVPGRVGVRAVEHLLGRDPATVFPAMYSGCYYDALASMLVSWQEFEVLPRYRGAEYFGFARWLQRTYLRYEDWTIETERRNLATHYLIRATR